MSRASTEIHAQIFQTLTKTQQTTVCIIEMAQSAASTSMRKAEVTLKTQALRNVL